jgi:hypothetical protein
VNLLIALPLLPLAVAVWLAMSSRAAQLSAGWLVALVAAFPVAVALLVSPERLEFPQLLVQGNAALVLDETARAALLLFGGLWLTAGLLLTRTREQGPTGIPLLVALSGALTLALAEGGPLVYAGMLATGYGLYAVMAAEPGDGWRRAGRALIVLLVLSDLLVFEILLSSAASPALAIPPGLLLLGLLALVLRSAIPPAHIWLPPALVQVSTPTGLLLVAVPSGAGLFGALKLVPQGAQPVALLCLLFGLAGATWAVFVGVLQVRARATLAYAVAASAVLLLMAITAGVGEHAHPAWFGLALLGSCAALPLFALQHAGWSRDLAAGAALILHGLAAGHLAVHAASVLPRWAVLGPPLAVIAASLLLTLATRRTPAVDRNDDSIEATRLAFSPIVLAAIGIGAGWMDGLPGFAALWPAPVGITLGLLLFRMQPRRSEPGIPVGDLLVPVERMAGLVFRWGRVACLRFLPRVRDRAEAWLLGLWDGPGWSERMHQLDLRLRSWPTTSVLMMVVALGAAYLMAR